MTLRALAALALLAGCAAQTGPWRVAGEGDALEGALRGRSAGTAVNCISTFGLRSSRALSGSEAILFEARGDLVYLNRPRGGCPGLQPDLALRTATPSGMLCAGDAVEAFDAATGTSEGACTLGPFTPYRRDR